MKRNLSLLLLLLVPLSARADAEKDLRKEVVVAAPVADVWAAWTTAAGVATFFAPKGKIEMTVGGAYEIYFAPDAPPGKRGAEGLKVLSYVPQEMVSFEWNAPPQFADIRKNGPKTWVVVQLTPVDARRTKVVLHHLGWRAGPDWEKLHGYFDEAWNIVMGRLQERFDKGPLDWVKIMAQHERAK